jgi:hypothetical protein
VGLRLAVLEFAGLSEAAGAVLDELVAEASIRGGLGLGPGLAGLGLGRGGVLLPVRLGLQPRGGLLRRESRSEKGQQTKEG